MAPRTRTNLAPNSSFNRALIRSAMVRKSKIVSSGSGMWISFMRSTSRAHSALASCLVFAYLVILYHSYFLAPNYGFAFLLSHTTLWQIELMVMEQENP